MPARVRAFLKAFSARFLMRFFLARRLAFFLAAFFFLARRLAFFFAFLALALARFLAAFFSAAVGWSADAVGLAWSSEVLLVLPSMGAEWAGTGSTSTVSAMATRGPQMNDRNLRMMNFSGTRLRPMTCRIRTAVSGRSGDRLHP